MVRLWGRYPSRACDSKTNGGNFKVHIRLDPSTRVHLGAGITIAISAVRISIRAGREMRAMAFRFPPAQPRAMGMEVPTNVSFHSAESITGKFIMPVTNLLGGEISKSIHLRSPTRFGKKARSAAESEPDFSGGRAASLEAQGVQVQDASQEHH